MANLKQVKFFRKMGSFLAFALLFIGLMGAKKAETVGMHGGRVLKDGSSEIEVKIAPKEKSVEVYLIKPDGVHPEAIEFQFVDREGKKRSFQLRATQHPQWPAYYTGISDPRMESFIGLEIRLPLTDGKQAKFKY